MFFQRFQFKGQYAEIYASPAEKAMGGLSFTISFNSEEDFHDIVKRLSKTQPDEQVKLAFYALESEMGERVK